MSINMSDLLGYMFIVIFALTALLTLLSLPNWINIGEWYRKKLFLALIIEVVGLVLLIGKDVLLPKDVTENVVSAQIGPGVKLRPSVNTRGDLSIVSPDSVTLGDLPTSSLQRFSLFSRINSSANDKDNNDVVKWESAAGDSKWRLARGKEMTNPPFKFEVEDHERETVYKITNAITGAEMFNSGTYQREGLFDLDNRMTHFYAYDNTYCLFRIISSELTNGKKRHVHVLQVKLDPELVSGDLKIAQDNSRRGQRQEKAAEAEK